MKKSLYSIVFFLCLLNKSFIVMANTDDAIMEEIEEFENALVDEGDDSQYFAVNATTQDQNKSNNSKNSSSGTHNSTTVYTDDLDDLDNIDQRESSYYLKIAGGFINFPSIENVSKFNGAGGFGLGASLTSNLKIEANFIYSFKQTEHEQWFTYYKDDIDQYSFSATGAYYWESLHWPLIPIVGVTTSLTHRRFNYDENTSNAFDLGFILGFDKKVNPRLSLGLEYRYMANIDYERDYEYKPKANFFRNQGLNLNSDPNVKSFESFDYQFVLLNVKLKF